MKPITLNYGPVPDSLNVYPATFAGMRNGFTINLEIDLGFGVTLETRVALAGVEEMTDAARSWIDGILSGEWILIRIHDGGDRWLAEIWFGPDYGVSLARELVKAGHAKFIRD